ncbi:Acyl-CoA hydrolase [Lutibacter flavus]|uniref:Acyl-CoA hydrolase n=2 Tax=Lutibacter flavus TaxID=691689 RepID=A0A238WY42_9FLAO|nr:Acyl-CoA hydrolase [Lutibacter flavus]
MVVSKRILKFKFSPSSYFSENSHIFAKNLKDMVKTPKESLTVLTDMVLPGETNPLGNLFGGELLARMDRACSIAARRHSRRIVVTASVNHVAFNKAVPVGSVVTIEAKVSRAFKSSMEIYVDVWSEDRESQKRTKVNEGIYTFVAVDRTGTPIAVPQIKPETQLEKERFEGALRRKQLSLILSGKMKPSDATELRALFLS